MRAEKDLGLAESVDPPGTVRIVLASNLDSIRNGLQDLFRSSLMTALADESRGTVEIVLAEVLNNITEHAYAKSSGDIELKVTKRPGFIFVRLLDWGLPMPGGDLPGGRLSESANKEDLPEGGFGWYLIRNLAHDLTYQREDNQNTLSFCITVDYR